MTKGAIENLAASLSSFVSRPHSGVTGGWIDCGAIEVVNGMLSLLDIGAWTRMMTSAAGDCLIVALLRPVADVVSRQWEKKCNAMQLLVRWTERVEIH